MGLVVSGCRNAIEPPPNEKSFPRDDAPTWSPDGKRIAYTHFSIDLNDSAYPTGLYVIDTDGTNRRLVIAGSANNPDWSPDGREIAFNSGDIYTITLATDSLVQITNVGGAFFPSWSPDGKSICYDITSGERNGILIADLRTGVMKFLGLGYDPDWSPDGNRLVYDGSPGTKKSEGQIWVVDTNGYNNNELTSNNSVINRYPSWSPDGSTIAWTTDNGIELMNADGNNQRQLYGDKSSQPSWSPDSRKIVFSKFSPSRNKGVLWIIKTDGADLHQLTF